MNRWLHWQFVVPRVLLVVVGLLAVQYVFGLAARSIAIRSGRAAFGPRGYRPCACVARGPASGVQRRAIDKPAPGTG